MHASSIWFWIKHDGGEQLLYANEAHDEEKQSSSAQQPPSQQQLDSNISDEGFDLLTDDFAMFNAINV